MDGKTKNKATPWLAQKEEANQRDGKRGADCLDLDREDSVTVWPEASWVNYVSSASNCVFKMRQNNDDGD